MKALFLLLLTGFSTFFYSQEKELAVAKNNKPLVLVDGVVAKQDLKQINPNYIESVSVYKSNIPLTMIAFENFLKDGIIDIKMKKKMEFVTEVPLHKINQMNGLTVDNPVYIDGFLVKNNSAKIFDSSIYEIQTVETNSGKVLNIWTLNKDERKNILPPKELRLTEPKSNRPDYIKQIQ